MKGDYLSYRVAAGRCVLGLIIQGALTATVLIYAVLANDHAALTAAIYAAIGLPAWLALAIVFDQHRRERVEAMEAQTITSQVGTSSVFGEDAAEFRVARNRLAAMYKYFLPIVSVVLGSLLVAAGLWRFSSGKAEFGADTFTSPGLRGWCIGVGLTMAVVGFIFARFISGMAKQSVWANLRGGAGFAVGTALMGLLLAVGAFVDYTGPDIVSRYAVVVFPLVMVILGIEVFLNFLLDLYRPRKPGDVPRPAFDSRVLGFVAAPDRIAESISEAINYQLGFNVSSSWFYRLLSRTVGLLVLLAVGVLWGLSCFAVLQPHERGMVLRFGRIVQPDIGPGLHLKAPWPIDRVEIPVQTRRNDKGRVEVVAQTATGVRTIELGTPPPAEDKRVILWTNEHAREEVYQIVQPSPGDAALPGSGPQSAANDLALVSVELPLHYAVRDVETFEKLAPPEFRDDLIRAAAQREIVEYFSRINVDQVLGGDRAALSRDIQERVKVALEKLNPDPVTGKPLGAGVELLFVGIASVHPPQQAAAAFERVVQAEQKSMATTEAAQADAIETLTKVVGNYQLANEVVKELDALDSMRERAAPGTPDVTGAVKDQEFRVQQLLDKAGGSASEIVAQARSNRWDRHMGERGRAARYRGQLASNDASPLVYRASLYFEALKAAMAPSRVYITSDRVPNLRIDLDLQDKDTGADVFDPNRQKDQ